MPRLGGQADTAGGEYQATFVARLLLDLLEGKVDSVRSNPPPMSDFGGDALVPISVDDAVTEANGQRTHFQAKRQAPNNGQWTPRKLASEGVLSQFISQLEADPRSTCVLVSSSPCRLFGELGDRARNAASEREFEANLSSADARLIRELAPGVERTRFRAYEFLRSCSAEVLSDATLASELSTRASRLFLSAASIEATLLRVARDSMTTGSLLTRQAVIDELAEAGFVLRPKASIEEIESKVRAASARLRSFPRGIEGVRIPRLAVENALAWIRDGKFQERPVGVFLDQAGSGKSAAMSELLVRLEADGFMALGLRLDGEPFSSASELAAQLGLEDLVPVALEALVRAGRRVALLLDQVDALSTAMGRDWRSLSVVLDLVARVAATKRVAVVLACRPFDWRFDHRLASLRHGGHEEFALPSLTDEELDRVLKSVNLTGSSLHGLTRAAIRSPLQLRLFVDLVKEKRLQAPGWAPPETPTWTLQSLYAELLRLKGLKSRDAGIPAGQCERTLGVLAQQMQAQERLTVPAARFCQEQATIDWLCSEGVLTRNALLISFAHQTLFDFAYAHWFVSQGHCLSERLRATDQGLFCRPMTRQILEYLRAVDQRRYRQELAELLAGVGIRAHLRSLALGWLGQVPDPTREEFAILETLAAGQGGWRSALQRFHGNPAWLDLLGTSRIASWLGSWADQDLDALLWYVASVLPQRQAEAISLLEPFLDRNEAWNARLAFVLARIGSGWTAASATLLLRVVGSPMTKLDDRGWWDHALDALSKDAPSRACQAIAAVLERCYSETAAEGSPVGDFDPSTPRRAARRVILSTARGLQSAIDRVAQQDPIGFLEAIEPFVLQVLDLLCESAPPQFFRDCHLLWELDHPPYGPTETYLVAGLRQAMLTIAERDQEYFRRAALSLAGYEFLATQRIVAQGYLRRPAAYASDAAEFLCSDYRRLCLGVDGSPVWLSAQLMVKCGSMWSENEFRRVEGAVLQFRELAPHNVDDLNRQGVTTLELLQALASPRLTTPALARLDQLERKFPGHTIRRPIHERAVWVGAPIEKEAIGRMGDSAWLRAMRRYDGKSRSHSRMRPIRLSGGVQELAREFQEQVKAAPARFLRLALERMDCSLNVEYLTAAISGLAEAAIPIDDLGRVIFRFLPAFGSGCVRAVAWSLRKYAEAGVPQSLVDLLEQWAFDRRGLDPSEDDVRSGREMLGRSLRGYDLGINTDRGAALDALAAIVLNLSSAPTSQYLALAARVVDDHSAAVRAVALRYLPRCGNEAPRPVAELVERLVGRDEDLLLEGSVAQCVQMTLAAGLTDLLWVAETLTAAGASEKARQVGAALSCIGGLRLPDRPELLQRCVGSDAVIREAAARVFARNVNSPQVGAICRTNLVELWNDPETKVRQAACLCFEHLEGFDLISLGDFLGSWARSQSVLEGAYFVSELLEKHPVADIALTLTLSESIIGAVSRGGADHRVAASAVPSHLVAAILGVYRAASDQDVRGRAMDLLEQTEALGWGDVAKAYESADRV
jgi:hypothetical protein